MLNGGQDKSGRRKMFWSELLPELKHSVLFTKISPTKAFWLSAGAGISGLYYTLVVTKTYAAIEFTLDRALKVDNKRFYKILENNKAEIEHNLGKSLVWEEMNESKMSRVRYQLNNVNFYLDSDIVAIKAFFIQNLGLFYDAFNPIVNSLKKR